MDFQPDFGFDVRSWKIPTNDGLADLNFHQPQRVNLLIKCIVLDRLFVEAVIKVTFLRQVSSRDWPAAKVL